MGLLQRLEVEEAQLLRTVEELEAQLAQAQRDADTAQRGAAQANELAVSARRRVLHTQEQMAAHEVALEAWVRGCAVWLDGFSSLWAAYAEARCV